MPAVCDFFEIIGNICYFCAMILLYRIYQLFVMCPLIVVVTILTAVATVVGSALGFGKWWGYYPEILWARIFCWLAFVKVSVKGRENIDPKVSYVFVANHPLDDEAEFA